MDGVEEENLKVLVLFFTLGVSFRDWVESGIVDREMTLYEKLEDDFDEIHLITYGVQSPVHEYETGDNVFIHDKKYISNDILYSLLIPFIHWGIIRRATILKTNQMRGSWSAVLASIFSSGLLVVRTGYVLSLFAQKQQGSELPARIMEWVAYNFADGIILPEDTE
jgi:hypothetical protein